MLLYFCILYFVNNKRIFYILFYFVIYFIFFSQFSCLKILYISLCWKTENLLINSFKTVIILEPGIVNVILGTFSKDFSQGYFPKCIFPSGYFPRVFSQVVTSQGYFPKLLLPKGIFLSGYFPRVFSKVLTSQEYFTKWLLPKGIFPSGYFPRVFSQVATFHMYNFQSGNFPCLS